ncbi:DUF4124 domain-containing protein [Oceanicoccus sagamiensis]|nr:DUF4124 domain-containing protein [Oceanicoccus sagamiensis]
MDLLLTIHRRCYQNICQRVIVYCALLLMPAMAVADIYQCVDSHGRPSFSHTPCAVESVTGDSAAHVLWRDMQVLVNTGKDNAVSQGADMQSIIDCKNREQAFAKTLDAIDQRLAQLSSVEHKYLFAAQKSLRQCGACGSSAMTHCKRADKSLEKEMIALMPQLKASSR